MSSVQKKADIVADICQLIGLRQSLHMSTGSTEPGQLFIEIDRALGLGLATKTTTKPQLAAAIVNAAGFIWLPTFESRGGTVTREGLLAVLEAVRFFRGETPHR